MTVESDTAATRREIELERERLTDAVGRLRSRVEQTRRQPFKPNAVSFVAAAVGGFVVAGGVHATMRLLGARERRRRERTRPALRELLGR